MASIQREIEISVPASRAWDALRDVGAPCAVPIGRFGKRAVGEPFVWLR